MKPDYSRKSTVDEIRERFDNDVERFSNLDTGQQTTIDAPLTMDLCTEAAKYVNPNAKDLLDIGCGAGNYTLKMLRKINDLNCTLVDLSMPMLERAQSRVSAETKGTVKIIQQDMRDLDFPEESFDAIFAAATFHHLRDDADWENVFKKMYRFLKPGGSIWISDLITHGNQQLKQLFEDRYAAYLDSIGGPGYRKKVLDYVEYEDTPRSLIYQLDLLRKTGFKEVEILHKNSSMAAFGAIK
ncbi:methyltransferase domain-containing protein [Pedobacter sp. HMF7647]|uniref:Methyltransferase domain-containing protein n=1 Tax=Hufsiella arboris TaxID=2695275 RepID=A0A7K1Y5B2_9SPHI|nr:class I SAM-dependent methyltransferase [Hufsiella arboris]MXV49772.1 methyltransferase domain-containing protein [Hufsiella arboris]